MLAFRLRHTAFLLTAAIFATGTMPGNAAESTTAKLGPLVPLRWEQGPVSFGLVLAGHVVAWSDPVAQDLLISRCWEGVYLYPSRGLTAEELSRDPIRVCPPFTEITMGRPVDWNRDGKDELIITDRRGYFYLCDRQGSFPNLAFPPAQPEREAKTGLEFNLPFENPNLPRTNSLGGYTNPDYFNYTYPVRYPSAGDKVDLIFGDWAGGLWWLPDDSEDGGRPRYTGARYEKSDKKEFSKPAEKVCDQSGAPFLLGEGIEGQNRYRGANTRPVVFRNRLTRSADLLVLAGAMKQQVFYLKRVNAPSARKPVFENLGEVRFEFEGGKLSHSPTGITDMGFHTNLIVIPSADGRNDLFVSHGCRLACYRNSQPDRELPAYRFSHYISSKDCRSFMSCPTEILKDRQGNRYLLDNTGVKWEFFRIQTEGGQVRFLWPGIPLTDQNGLFKVEAETDPQGWEVWGFHRSARWNFDGSGRQHLVVGTDKGLLYLLIEDEDAMAGPAFQFRSAGPLKDSAGHVVRVHNRAVAAGVDLDGDGHEDLVAGGISYQLGTYKDPNPGGGFYYLLHKGLDKDGLPILEPMKPLPMQGYHPQTPKNSHVQMQVVDLDGDGAKEVILASQRPDSHGRVFRPMKDKLGLQFTGAVLPDFSIEHYLVDLDRDGQLELVFGGAEQGVGYYREIQF